MTEHVELYDKNCEFMFWLNVIKLTKFVNFFYKKNYTISITIQENYNLCQFKVWNYNCKFLERKLTVECKSILKEKQETLNIDNDCILSLQ